MNKENVSEKTIIKTTCDSVNHTRFPEEDHLPDWAHRDNKVRKGDCAEALVLLAYLCRLILSVSYCFVREIFVNLQGLCQTCAEKNHI
jgi:hypothetical protein